jgi:DNA-binding transcriptional MerR regulator/methylmalonyl-CoA mutase cobalamin-binding subunit
MAADQQGYPIKVVVHRTGLNPHVIRVWEKRYNAVSPSRTPTRRRLYTEAEIERLFLLRKATLAGHSIGRIARLPTEKLRELAAADDTAQARLPTMPRPRLDTPAAVQPYLEAALKATERLDAVDLEATLMRARVALSHTAFIETLIVPLMQHVGDLWREGTLRVMHEHLASAVVRTLLGSLVVTPALSATAPHLIATTPAGQLHEIGALIAGAIAATEGWGVTYLGANLPAVDIAAAAQQHHAGAVALSIVYPPDDPHLGQELATLRRYLRQEVTLFVSGRGADGYAEVLEQIGAVRPSTWGDFRAHLEALRTGPLAP